MPINDTHPKYALYEKDWKKCRDAKEGQSAIHRAGKEYLPYLSGQGESEYNAYRDRALFFGATGRTIDGLTGMLFRKPVNVDAGGIDEDILNDIDMMDLDVQGFCESLADEVMTVGRVGILVDFPSINTEGLSVAMARQMNARPFLKTYEAESIINWHMTRINNRKTLSHVYLMEEVIVEGEDGFQAIEQIRALRLIEGVYIQTIYRKEKKDWIVYDEIVPLMNGQPLPYIPFIFCGAMGTQADISKPPLMDLVNVNISHYKTTADLEHGAHFTGLPTAVITGFNNEEDAEFRIGSSTAWTFSNPDTEAFYLEFEGKGLGTLQELLREKEAMMAALGSQMLTPDTKRNETEGTARLRHGGEHATLASISISITNAMNKALTILADWLGVEPATIEINRDFMPVKIDPAMMQQLFLALQGGRISYQTYFDNLKQGEIISSEKTVDDELAEIQTADTVI